MGLLTLRGDTARADDLHAKMREQRVRDCSVATSDDEITVRFEDADAKLVASILKETSAPSGAVI